MTLSIDEAFVAIFNSPAGEEFLKYLRQSVGMNNCVFREGKNGFDPLAAAFRDGRRSVVLEIEHNLERFKTKQSAPSVKAKKL